MAFQPNYYQPQYVNPYLNYGAMNFQASQPIPQQQPLATQQPQMNQYPILYGKVVDGLEVVKATDVPIGMSFIMPNANGNSIYSKGWNTDGTTFLKEYKLVEQTDNQTEKETKIDWSDKFDDIYDAIDELGKKIDKIKLPSSTTTSSMKKRRVGEDDE